MKIGRVEIPALKKIDKKPRKGGVYDITLTGVCFKTSTYTDSLDDQVENVQSLKAEDLSEPKLINAVGVDSPVPVDSKAAYNFIDYTGLKGFLAVKDVSETKSAEELNIREVSISGTYLPDSIYKRNLQLGITDLANDRGITGRTLVALPVNSTDIVGASQLYSVDTEDGTVNIYEASGDEVAFSCDLADEELGAVTVWDTNSTTVPTATDLANKSTGGVPWTKVLNREHDSGENILIIENGLVAFSSMHKSVIDIYFYDGTAWNVDLSTFEIAYANSYVKSIRLSEISPDCVKLIVRSSWTTYMSDTQYTLFRGSKFVIFKVLWQNTVISLLYGLNKPKRFGYTGANGVIIGDTTVGGGYDIYLLNDNWGVCFDETGNNLYVTGGTLTTQKIRFDSLWDAVHPLTQNDIGFFALLPFNTTNLFAEAEASTETTGTVVSDADASGGSALELSSTGEYVNTWRFNPFSDSLPDGTYRLFIRYKADIATADVLKVEVMDDTTATAIASATYTPASTGAYIYVYLDFTIDSTTDPDNIYAQVSHNGTTEVLDIDYSLIVPITNGKNFPQDIAHDAMRLVEPRRELKVR